MLDSTLIANADAPWGVTHHSIDSPTPVFIRSGAVPMLKSATFKQRRAFRRARVVDAGAPDALRALAQCAASLTQIAADLAVVRRNTSCITDVLFRADAGDSLYMQLRPDDGTPR